MEQTKCELFELESEYDCEVNANVNANDNHKGSSQQLTSRSAPKIGANLEKCFRGGKYNNTNKRRPSSTTVYLFQSASSNQLPKQQPDFHRSLHQSANSATTALFAKRRGKRSLLLLLLLLYCFYSYLSCYLNSSSSSCCCYYCCFTAAGGLFRLQFVVVQAEAQQQQRKGREIYVKIGALLEESDHEQANMFIRTIKMINERKDETIRQMLNISSSGGGTNIINQQHHHHHQQPQQQHSQINNNQHSYLKSTTSGGSDDDAFGLHSKAVRKQTKINDDDSGGNDEGHATAGDPLDGGISLTMEALHLSANSNHNKLVDMVVKLEPMIEFLQDRQSSFEADSKVCQLIESGVHAIVGPTDGASIQHVQSICDNMEIPYFELRPFLGSPAALSLSSFQSSTTAAVAATSASILMEPPTPTNKGSSKVKVLQQQQFQATLGLMEPDGDATDADSDAAAAQAAAAVPPQQQLGNDDNSASNGRFKTRARTGEEMSGSGRAQANDDMDSSVVVVDSVSESGLGADFAAISSSPPVVDHHHQQHQPIISSSTTTNRLEDLTLNLYPPAHLLTSAYIDLIYAWNWTSFAIVYEDGNSMIKLQDLFKESSGSWTSKWQIKLFQFNPTTDSGYNNRQQNGPNNGNNNNNHHNNNNNNNDHQNQNINMNLYSLPPFAAPPGFSGDERNTSTLSQQQAASEQANGRLSNGRDTNQSNNLFVAKGDTDNIPLSSSQDVINQFRHRRKRATFRDIFWRIKLSGEQNILLDVKTENLYEALKQAQQVGCMTERYSYLITSLDLHTIDLEDFKYSRTKITAFNILQVARFQQPAYSKKVNGDTNNDLAAQQHATSNTTTTTTTSAAAAEKVRSKRSHLSAEQQRQAAATDGLSITLFDEKYLEKLGVHVIQSDDSIPAGGDPFKQGAQQRPTHRSSSSTNSDYYQQQQRANMKHRLSKYKLSPSVVLDRSGPFMDPPSDAYKDWSRREQLLSSPASMGLLPSVDRDNEQRLFEFFVDQQERNLSRVRLSTPSAILHDSLILFMLGLNELDPSGLFIGQQEAIACSLGSHPWLHGSSLVNYMRRVSFNGLTGPISFDQRGLRSDFKLDMMGMAPDIGMIKVGEWYSKKVADTTSAQGNKASGGPNEGPSDRKHMEEGKSYDELSSKYELQLKTYNKLLADGVKVPVPYTKPMSRHGALLVNEIIFERLYREQADQIDTLIVTTKLSQPYFMLKETPNKLEGNDQYEGFAVDLIHELSKLVNFKYRWREVEDKKYGSKEVLPNGTVFWNGMIGEIVRGQADLAIVDLTITAQREEAVDFTLPFMNTGISILFKKPTTKVTTLFSFLSPFSSDVWAYVLAAYCGISAILFLVGHLSPYEWADPHPCRHTNEYDQTVLRNQFSLLNSFWFTIGSLMQQGSDLTPRSMSTRTIAGIWYFFTLIMISSYTANLAAFLTVEKVVYPIENARDLSYQQEIKYGCVESGSTCTFFHDSQIDTYKRINGTMRKFKTYVKSNDEGQKRVEEGKFAFFMESASIEYIVERNCNLTQIGGLLDSKGYGLATSKKSRLKRPYRTLLSEGILHLQETGMLHILKNRWWKERRGGGTCTDDGKGGGVTELSLANVGGVFVVLLGGLGISFLVAIAEFMWRARRSGSTRDRMCEEMMSDLKFALACKSSTKPVVSSTRGENGTRKSRSSMRQLMEQNSSFLSQSDADVDPTLLVGRHQIVPQCNNNGAGKECDPILFHAMLTMLMQQQQQRQQQQQQTPQQTPSQLQRQQTLEQQRQQYLPAEQGAPNKQVERGSRLNNNISYSIDPSQVLSANHAPGAASAGELSAYTDRVGDIEHHRLGWISSRSEAGKRRLLFAQQTIDTADESFLAQQQDATTPSNQRN